MRTTPIIVVDFSVVARWNWVSRLKTDAAREALLYIVKVHALPSGGCSSSGGITAVLALSFCDIFCDRVWCQLRTLVGGGRASRVFLVQFKTCLDDDETT